MKKLNELKNFKGVQGPVVTIVMDGVGISPDTFSRRFLPAQGAEVV